MAAPGNLIILATPSSAARGGWMAALPGRELRVRILIAAIWVLSLFDYVHTLNGVGSGLVDECNPLALRVLPHGALALLAFKLALVIGATLILYVHRRRALVELVLGVSTLTLLGVLARWQVIYALYDYSLHGAPPGYPMF